MGASDKNIERAKKYLEYKSDIIKWAEECVYLPTPGGDKLVKLYEPQKRTLKSFFKYHYLVLLKSRQTGFSTLSQIICAYLATFYKNVVMGVVSRDGAESSDFNRKVLAIIQKQPEWLRPKFVTENAQSFITTKGCQLWAGAISPANPGSLFRGKAITLLIIDEAAFARNIEEAWTAMAPTLSKAQKDAGRNNIPFGTIVLSTPNKTEGIGKWYFDMWSLACEGTSIWKAHKIYWKEIPDYANDPNWYKQQCELLKNDSRKIAQEMELKFIPSGGGIFNKEVYDILQEVDIEPLEKIKVNVTSELWKFEEINKSKFYLIGVDTGTEWGIDNSTIEVLDYVTMSQVLEFQGKLEVKDFISIIKTICAIVPNNILLIENNSFGYQVANDIYKDSTKQYNVYGQWKDRKINSSKIKDFQPGISTNAKTRPVIMDSMYTYVNQHPELIKSTRLAHELIGLTDINNKIQADAGSKDDLVLAFAFCCYARDYLKETLGHATMTEEEQTESFSWISGLNSDKDSNGSSSMKYSSSMTNYNKTPTMEFIRNNFDKFSGHTTNVLETLIRRR